MAVTENLGLASPLASAVSGWIARIKADFGLVDSAFGGMGAIGNLLTNPSFEFNQRTVGSYTGNGTWGPDRWQVDNNAGGTLTITWDAVEVADPSSAHSAKVDFDFAGAGQYGKLAQLIEGGARYAGRALALRVWVKCSTANAVRAFINDGAGVTYSAYHPGDGLWHALDVVRTLDAAATVLQVGTYATNLDSTHWADNATLVHGSVPLPYVPLHPSVERALVDRYYEVHIGNTATDWPYFQGYADGAEQDVVWSVPWKVLKGTVAPTAHIGGTWIGVNTPATAPALVSMNDVGYAVKVTSTAAGPVSIRADHTAGSARGYIAGESNP